MARQTFAQLNVGDMLPELRAAPVNRTTLSYFAGASGDDNPIHIDSDFARKAGMPDVFAHGMLGMAYLGRLLTNWVAPSALRSFGVRFVAITNLGNEPILTGKVVEKLEKDGEKLVRVEVQMTDQFGQVKIQGEALVALG